MPVSAPTVCAHPGCGVAITGNYCPEHRHAAQQRRKASEAYRNKARGSAHERGYTAAWQRASKAFLRKHPLCAACDEAGIVQQADLVDHIIPHRGNWGLFWDVANWQALCASCHNAKTARGE